MIFDVVVIGGGPAGAAAARVLAAAGCRTLLVDKASPNAFKIGESLIPSACNLLAELGVLNEFLADEHLPSYGYASAWGSDQLDGIDFIRSPYGHGWHLDRARFDALLCNAAVQAGAAYRLATRLVEFERLPTGNWEVRLNGLQGREAVSCRWLLDCTGRRRRIVRHLGIPCRYADRLIASYARFQPQAEQIDQDSLSLIESVPDGWWYTAKLPSNQRIVVFFTDATIPCVRSVRSPEGFIKQLGQTLHIREKLTQFSYSMIEKPKVTDARSSCLENFYAQGWMAVGDAAISFDPLSSQGIFTALYGGLKAAKALLESDSGDSKALERYDEALSSVYIHFLINRYKYYQSEQRWTQSMFWKIVRSGYLNPDYAGC